MNGAFANPDLHTRSWYVACRAEALRPGRIHVEAMLGRRTALYRGADGAPRALDARCPHLGADLGMGAIDGDGLICAFHRWRIGPDGRCGDGRRARAWPALERWGLIWVFNGPAPTYALPEIPGRPLRLPAQELRCHHHLVVANGIDVGHLGPLHGLELIDAPEIAVEGTPEAPRARVPALLRPRSALLRRLTGTRRAALVASFTAIAGSLAVARVEAPAPFTALFAGRAGEGAWTCRNQALLFLPSRRPRDLLKIAAILFTLLRQDRKILEGMDFAPDFTAADEPTRGYAAAIDRMKTW